MNQNVLLFSIILIMFAAVSALESKKHSKSFNPSKLQLSKKKKCVDEDPCFLFENTNRSQVLYLKLITALKKLSQNQKRTLGCNCKEEVNIQGTSSNRLKTEVSEVTKIILHKVNATTGFYFKKVYLDTITVYEDKIGNKNFKYNVFVYDSNEELDLRFYIDVIKYIIPCPKKSKAITCTSVTTPGMDSFEIGYPQPEQLVPLPTEVISTGAGGELLSTKGINIKRIEPIRYLYINEVKIYNTNAVINADGKCLMDPVCGNIKDTTLSSSVFNQPTTPFTEPACVRNKWPRLNDEPRGVTAWPTGAESPYWNKLGIPTPPTCNTQICGTRSSTTQFPIQASFWRNNYALPRNSGPNFWLFNLVRGNTQQGADFTD